MHRWLRYCFIVLVSLTLTACSWLPTMPWSKDTGRPAPARAAEDTFEIISAGLLTDRSGRPELAAEIRNASEQLFWARVSFFTPDSAGDCLLVKELAARTSAFYRCPQTAIYPSDYRIQIEIFSDETQNTLIDQFATTIPVDQTDIDVFRNLPKS
jgi:hypothetical protein